MPVLSRICFVLSCLALVLAGCASETEAPQTASPAVTLKPSPGVPPVGSTIDVARLGYLDNLLARVGAQELDADEALELSLRALVGASNVHEVLWSSELASYDLTGLIASARAALADNPTPLREAQIQPSLRFLVFDADQLRRMRVDPNGPQPTALRITPPPILGPDETDAEEEFDPASRSLDTDCELFFRRFPVSPGTATCLTGRAVQLAGMSYNVYAPVPSIAPFHWNQDHHAWIDEAVGVAVPIYQGLGELPAFDIVLAANLDAPAEAATLLNDDSCIVVLYTDLQLRPRPAFQQVIARQLAHCFFVSTFPNLATGPYQARRWVEDGLATYLSTVAFPDGDIELAALETLGHIASTSSVTDWSSASFVLFQYLSDHIGPEGVVDLVGSLDGETVHDTTASLAAWPGIEVLFHEFALAYTDGTIRDSQGDQMLTAWEPGEGTFVDALGPVAAETVPSFGIRRAMFVVPADRLARFAPLAAGALSSTRPYSGSEWNPFPETFPARCFEDNRLVVVTTTTQAGGYEPRLQVPSFDPVC